MIFRFLPRLAVQRPVLATMLVVIFVVLGFFSFTQLRVDLYPDVEFPVVSVTTAYPGAGPEEVEVQVTEPIEDAVSNIANLDELTSFSRENVSIVVMQFDLDVDPDLAAIDVKDQVDAIRGMLPDDAEPPVVQKFDIDAFPILNVALSGPQGADLLFDLADDEIRERLSRVDGVADISVVGGRVREVEVQVHPDRLDAYEVTLGQIVEFIRAENLVTLTDDRDRTTQEMMAEVRPLMAQVPDADVTVQLGGGGGGPQAGADILVQVTGPADDLEEVTEQITDWVREVSGLTDVRNTIELARPEFVFRPDRPTMGDLGLTLGEVGNLVRAAVEGEVAGVYREAGDEIDIRVRFPEAERRRTDQFDNLQVPVEGGRVPLASLGSLELEETVPAIRRENRQRAYNVEADIAAGNLTERVADVEERLSQESLPPGYEWQIGGEFEDFEDALGEILRALLLVGIVVNNAILILDYAGQLRAKGQSAVEALLEAGPVRLRPIVMSNVAIAVVLLPQALGTGAGAAFRVPMAVVTIGGAAVAAVFTLFLIPVIYLKVETLTEWARARTAGIRARISGEEEDELASASSP